MGTLDMGFRKLGFGLFCLGLTLGNALAGPLDTPANDKLTGEAIKSAWFTGEPFMATAPDGTVYRFVFQPDGHASKSLVPKAPAAKKGPSVSGFWRIIAEGYCVRWTGSVREKCFNIRKEGDTTVARFGKVVMANWTK